MRWKRNVHSETDYTGVELYMFNRTCNYLLQFAQSSITYLFGATHFFPYVNTHGFSTPISKILHFTTYHITFNDNYLLCKSRGDWVRIHIYGSSFSACAPGTWGKNCSDTCPDGFYGLFCENRCPCKKCNKVTGCGGTCNC